MKYLPLIILWTLSMNACIKMKAPQPNDFPQIANEWRAEPPVLEYQRNSAMVHSTPGKVFLLPGKGHYHFSSNPQIMSFDGDSWTFEFMYDGFSSAGGGYWSHNDLAYSVGGINGSGATTRAVVSIDFEAQSTKFVTDFLHFKVYLMGSCNTASKGYITTNVTTNPALNSVYSYDFETEVWDSMPKPIDRNDLVTLLVAKADTIFLFYSESADNNFFYKKEGAVDWNALPDFPGAPRVDGSILQYSNYLIVGMGLDALETDNVRSDIWVFNINTSTWKEVAPYPGKAFHSGMIFEWNDRLYIGGGMKERVLSLEAINEEMWSIYLE